MDQTRRSLLIGVGALIAAPAIVRVSSLMPVKVIKPVLVTGQIGSWEGMRFIVPDRCFYLDTSGSIYMLDGVRMRRIDELPGARAAQAKRPCREGVTPQRNF